MVAAAVAMEGVVLVDLGSVAVAVAAFVPNQVAPAADQHLEDTDLVLVVAVLVVEVVVVAAVEAAAAAAVVAVEYFVQVSSCHQVVVAAQAVLEMPIGTGLDPHLVVH